VKVKKSLRKSSSDPILNPINKQLGTPWKKNPLGRKTLFNTRPIPAAPSAKEVCP
jgi:hypothetical protein